MKKTVCDAMSVASETMERLPRGAFLTVRHKHRLNTMTIGWATVGIMWARPVFMAAVRNTRYTFKLIEQTPDFTVSLPTTDAQRKALAVCGTRSGKDCDKFAECGLTVIDAEHTDSPIIELEGLHFECRTLMRSPMSPDLMHPDLAEIYPDADYHTFYFGEVLACYRLQA